MTTIQLSGLILCLPVAGFFIQWFFGEKLPRKHDWLATGIMGVVVAMSLLVFFRTVGSEGGKFACARSSCEWFRLSPGYRLHVGFLVDNLAATLLVVVSVVSGLVHLFSIGYMHGDSRYVRYFAVLQLFTAAMLGLVLSDNLLTLYVSWELMGLSSYLLIGHFFEKPSAANASLKAFMTTRIGDVLMFVGILILFAQVGSLRYADIFAAVKNGTLAGDWQLWAGLLLFGGAMGKSAQFPLHVWLPDAMEGPTPVSALIHAATMVAAGVYLMARMVLLLSAETFLIIAYIGGFTALFAATIGVVMDDIKKVLAYSTISQLGYMMLGLGVGGFVVTGYTGGVYHLTTHAFFKACLFLGSGSVIHAVHTQSMSQMGGLYKKIPITFATFGIATLSLTGFPYLTTGFWTKDTIIQSAIEFYMRHPQHVLLPFFAIGAAFFTSFYMFRLIFLTFFGKPRNQHAYDHAHESSWVMTVPLIILALLSVSFIIPVAGPHGNWFWQRNPLPVVAEVVERYGEPIRQEEPRGQVLTPTAPFADVPKPVDAPGAHVRSELQKPLTLAGELLHTERSGAHEKAEHEDPISERAHGWAVISSILVFLLGAALATAVYFYRVISPEKAALRFGPVYRLLLGKYFIDEFYHAVVIRPFLAFSDFLGGFDKWIIDGLVNLAGLLGRGFAALIGVFDNTVVDGAVNQAADQTARAGALFSRMQTGRLGTYLLGIVSGMAFLGFMIWITTR